MWFPKAGISQYGKSFRRETNSYDINEITTSQGIWIHSLMKKRKGLQK